MNKKYYFISTNAYECIASVKDETVRVLVENNQEPFPHDDENGHTSSKAALQFLCRIEDDSSWEVMEGMKTLEDVFNFDTTENKIISSIDESETFVYHFEIVMYGKEFPLSKKKAIKTGCTYTGDGDLFPKIIQSFSGCRLNLPHAMEKAAEAFKNCKSSVEKTSSFHGTLYNVTEYTLEFNVYTADGEWVDANTAGYYKCNDVLLTSSDRIQYTKLYSPELGLQ